MSIAVTAPTGQVGSRVVRLLVQAGVRPTLLLRDPDKLDPLIRPLVDVRAGDQRDADYVREATKGAHALFWLDTTPHVDDDPIGGSAELGRIAAGAVRANEIGHVVFLSSVGAERRAGVGHIDGLARIEESLDATGAAVVHLRCGYFFSNLLMSLDALREGVLPTARPVDAPMAWVDPRDVGEVVAARLLAAGWSGREAQAVHGPEDLTHAQVAEVLSEVTGRRIAALPVTDDDVRGQLRGAGLPEAAVEGIVGMTAGTRDDFVPEQPREPRTTTPTTLGQWAWEHLRPLLA
ncbi:NAD(P)H-binding protein [Pseudonocardia lacus]|uniref:NmrA family NAD(P)-binding protein n=1 Tax=Pseudonocardia lacus TaxID=2835865 RepID=UPI001BDC9C37|nr:NAD(P)H-binding protein [Pseudonocardia lacus]